MAAALVGLRSSGTQPEARRCAVIGGSRCYVARDPVEGECDPNWGGDVVPVSFAKDYPPSPLRFETRRRGWNGHGTDNYFRKTKLRPRERSFAELYASGFLSIAPVLVSAERTRIREVLVKLAMDAVEAAHYHPPGEASHRKQAFYLMNMPRVQAEIDRIMARQGLSKERMSARLAEIMEGKNAESWREVIDSAGETRVLRSYDANAAADRSLRAIDLAFRATTGFAPTNNRVQLAMDGNTYDAEVWKDIPEIAIDPALERKPKGVTPKLVDSSLEEEEADGDSDEEEDEYEDDDIDDDIDDTDDEDLDEEDED